ncbi:helix-turn-helix transcriptional regulator [Leucobacter massiliensis]|uniref:Transcriptional regulator n=1 Tax=Leucobacter massiliensis TaxID=1686285 RepID=A0A2S9QQV6_9MICO|nr:WYL domain-containing protein [Leucobacter massiliensis]PRI11974.1 transcriptional regulator [Leucobacter massiliensis]
MAARVPGEQRIFSLVLALVVSPEGLTKRELLSSVHGYAERYRQDGPSGALDRQFERDKEQLRALGIQIETRDSPLEPGNNQLTRYRIPKESLEFPPELRFDERELTLLRLAALAWREGSLSAESRRAAMRLEALGAGLDVRQLGVAPQLGSAEPASAPLRRAIEERRVVRFDYALPGRLAPLARRAAPLRLHRADGRWHLLALDLDRDAERVFLLARIAGAVEVTGERFDEALLGRADGMVEELLRVRERQRATVRVRVGSAAEARLRPRATTVSEAGDGAVDMGIGVLDQHLFAEELIGYGADAVVVEPEQLRGLVAGGLRRIARQHAADGDERAGDGTASGARAAGVDPVRREGTRA